MKLLVIIVVVLIVAAVDEAMAGVCPPPGEIAPCSCTDLGSEGLVIQLNCRSANLNDARASQILDKMISWPRVSPLRYVDFSYNQLTKVPNQLPQFGLLNNVNLNANQITSIKASAFDFVATFTSISLNSNPITSIQEGAFQGFFGDSTVSLQSTSLSRFEAGVFQSMLEQIEPYNPTGRAYVDIYNNPIDCTSDPCHLAWLVFYNRQLLQVVRNSRCTHTGQSFSQLDRNSFFDCPFLCSASNNGNYSDPKSCTHYYSCNNGTPQLQTCPIDLTKEQLIFDPLTKKCDQAAKTPGCSVRPFLCPMTGSPPQDANYPNRNSCHSYYRCVNDVPYLLDCGLLVFNESKGQCDTSGCVITTTTTIQTTTSSVAN